MECVGHIADTEIFFTDRIVRTIAMDRPLLMSPDEKLFIERLDYQGFDLDEQLALFTALRRHAARILRAQLPESWFRTAVRSESGLLTLRQLVLQAVRHPRHHLPFVAEKRAALGGPPVESKSARKPAPCAALLFEYVDADRVLASVIRLLKPGGVLTAVLQLPNADAPTVTPSPFISLQSLTSCLRMVSPEFLRARAAAHDLTEVESVRVTSFGGKSFQVQSFIAAAPEDSISATETPGHSQNATEFMARRTIESHGEFFRRI